MSVAIRRTVEIEVLVGGETVTLVCRQPTAQQLSGFLNARFEAKGRKVKSHLYSARTGLIDQVLVDIKNATYENAQGELKTLNASTVLSEGDVAYWSGILGSKVESWKDLIPMSWKSSAAMRFEDPQPEDDAAGEGDSKN